MEAGPWDALDLDDSDLPSLLRPCKRRHSTTSAENPLPQSSPEQAQRQPQPCIPVRRKIPGPAGAVETAMLRKNIDRENRKASNYRKDSGEDTNGDCDSDGVIPTQDYIRRATEDTAEFDEDFTRQTWISALQYLGAKDGVVKSTPISSIKKCVNGDKAVQVVVVIKSCTPNGLGGLVVSLKDPTGTVGASIHHKVLSVSEFGKNLTTGSVLILREVAIFSPARSTVYLNITMRNLEKVFCHNSASSSSELNESIYPVQYADPGVENRGNAKTIENDVMMEMEDVEKTQHPRKTENRQNPSVIQRQNLFTRSVQFTNTANITVNAVRNITHDDACYDIRPDINIRRITGDHPEFVEGNDKGVAKGRKLEGNLKSSMESSGQETQAVQTQIHHVKLKASVLTWTDEQLDQLCVDDYDDNDHHPLS